MTPNLTKMTKIEVVVGGTDAAAVRELIKLNCWKI